MMGFQDDDHYKIDYCLLIHVNNATSSEAVQLKRNKILIVLRL